MKHHRRRKLLNELHSLYLDNFKNSSDWSWERTATMLRYFQTLRNKMEIDEVPDLVKELQQKKEAAARDQLTLF